MKFSHLDVRKHRLAFNALDPGLTNFFTAIHPTLSMAVVIVLTLLFDKYAYPLTGAQMTLSLVTSCLLAMMSCIVVTDETVEKKN